MALRRFAPRAGLSRATGLRRAIGPVCSGEDSDASGHAGYRILACRGQQARHSGCRGKDDLTSASRVPPEAAKAKTFIGGASGLYSTAADYWRFSQMLLNGGTLNGHRILGPRTIRWMTENHIGDIPHFRPRHSLRPRSCGHHGSGQFELAVLERLVLLERITRHTVLDRSNGGSYRRVDGPTYSEPAPVYARNSRLWCTLLSWTEAALSRLPLRRGRMALRLQLPRLAELPRQVAARRASPTIRSFGSSQARRRPVR